MLLTFLCLAFRKTQQFPANRAQVYKKAVRIFLEEWNAHKSIHNERLYKDLTPELELELLKDIAGPSYLESRIFFSGEELTAYIATFLRTELNAPRSLSPNEILTAIAVQQGLFVERAQNVWTFSHLTIQEYLAAAWILEEGQANEIILAHGADDRWREVFLLMSGLTRADGILTVIGDSAEAFISDAYPRTRVMFSCLHEAAQQAWQLAPQDPAAARLTQCGAVCRAALLRAIGLFLARIVDRTASEFYVYRACELTIASIPLWRLDTSRSCAQRSTDQGAEPHAETLT